MEEVFEDVVIVLVLTRGTLPCPGTGSPQQIAGGRRQGVTSF
jgi:hypothetical protein